MSKFLDLLKKFCGNKNKKNPFLKVNVKSAVIDNNNTNEQKIIEMSKVKYLVVDTGLKYEGIIALSEFKDHIPVVGDTIPAILLQDKVVENYFVLSYQKAKFELTIQKFKKNSNFPLIGKVVQILDNGYKIEVFETIGFLHADAKLELGQEIECFFNSISNNTVIFSMKKNQIIALQEGSEVNCVIKSINSALIIVDILLDKKETIEGVIDVNDYKIHNYGKTVDFQIGDKIIGKVVKNERENILLTVKDFLIKKWSKNIEQYTIDQEVMCKIIKIKNTGVIAIIDDGLEVFIPNSEAVNSKTRILPNQIFKINDQQKGKIIEINKETQNIKVSFKPYLSSVFDDFKAKYKVGDKVNCKICNSTNTFIFARIEDTNIDGVINFAELSWNPEESRILFADLKDKKKSNIEAIITDIIDEKNHVTLSVKRLTPDPFIEFEKTAKRGTIYDCTLIEKLDNGGLLVNVKNTFYRGFIRRSDIDHENRKKLENNFKAQLIGIDSRRRNLLLSLRNFDEKETVTMSASLSDLIDFKFIN